MGWKMNCGMSCLGTFFEAIVCWGLEPAKHCIGAETWPKHGWPFSQLGLTRPFWSSIYCELRWHTLILAFQTRSSWCDRILCIRMIVVLSSRPSTGVKEFNVANTSNNIIWFALMLHRRRVSWTDHVHSGFARCGPVGSLEVETQGWAQDGLQHKTGQDKTSWSVIPNGSSLTAWLVTWPIGHEHG